MGTSLEQMMQQEQCELTGAGWDAAQLCARVAVAQRGLGVSQCSSHPCFLSMDQQIHI